MGYKVLSKKEICPNQYEMQIEAPYVVRNAKAGQFIIFRVEQDGERVPLTVADVDKEKGILTIVFMAVGYTTKKLAMLNAGDELVDIVGPLGKPTDIKKYGTVVCIAGGYGAAPCYLISKAFKEAGNKVYMISGARTKDLLFWEDKMKSACTELYLTTDDGSYGIKGFGTTVLQQIIDREPVDYVIAVGPMPMMRAVANLTRDKGIYTEASMNPIMVDGTGMCGACRLTVGGKTKFACIDGPDFNAHEVDFDEVINRNKIYREQEHKRDEECNLFKQKVRG
ncbi:MAG: sulfide/dihydroorotate dehydrogenase-like FAD/NAD-binding protein [Cyanobacteriota bacterium]|nr:sulfide/dihydroorotate dehydrogenase-like FAD/NAD-binding protein [Cyanobacteriota bacterium]MDY6358990.1 sulfide/dihydroorotate dehydrogenase-like FAD/NAD-binding protein [Cyanobacteriota bacterium]MDY6364276.1 sulfide/dihydroorotate dehydrogenase-like FAD/NAD-binding protein [Cyanobacteriota bacterium]MDY6382721.1 sulfide/dihydroorotate dehydrogenase-like FAD/NAD-binding protein [Cyanobacteriota bacterium]